MRIHDQDWEPVSNGQIIHRISPSTIGFVAKIYRVDDTTMTHQDWLRLNAIATVPEMLRAIENILRCFDRDDLPVNRFDRPMGKGVQVHITYRQARRLRDLLEKATASQEGVQL
jgi:hypothetical protein